MLLNHDINSPLFVIGTGPSATELHTWISKEAEAVNITLDEYNELPADSQCLIGFQTIEYRVNFIRNDRLLKHKWPTYIHPSAVVSRSELVGVGTMIGPLSVIGDAVKVGNFCSIGPLVSVGHNTRLGNNCVISPSVTIGGSTTVGNTVYFGQSCSIKDKITICDEVKFHMTSVVTKSIDGAGTYFGNKKVQQLS